MYQRISTRPGATREGPPTLALTVGDPAGIGPEICLEALAEPEVRAAARILVLGPGALRPDSIEPLDPAALEPADADGEGAGEGTGRIEFAGPQAWLDTGGPDAWELGRPQASCGRAALDALARGAALARAGRVGALVTGPVSKEALHLAGEPVEGQTELLTRWDGAEFCQMMALAGPLRVMLLTRHLPLRTALEQITEDRVVRHLKLLHDTLIGLGIEAPRLALAGLNPHAGEAGLLGGEEREVLIPAAARARAAGLDVTGPVSPDTVFAQAAAGRHDAVLALYHDQAFIPIKLLAPDTGLTLLAGLSYLRLSPVHGTAFDIAGRGLASHANLTAALLQAARWAF